MYHTMSSLESVKDGADLPGIIRFNGFIEYIQRTQFFSNWEKSQLMWEINRITAIIDEKSQSWDTDGFLSILEKLNWELHVLTHCGEVPNFEDLVKILWSFQNPESTQRLKYTIEQRTLTLVDPPPVGSSAPFIEYEYDIAADA